MDAHLVGSVDDGLRVVGGREHAAYLDISSKAVC